MSFLDKLFGKKKEDKTPSKPPISQAGAGQPAGPKGEISRVYLYVASTIPLNAATADQITTFGLEQLKADPTFRQIMAKVERDQIPMVKGHGVAPSSSQFADSFKKWLKKQGTSLDDATAVMGKKLFVQGGDAQNPADGTKFSWGLVGSFK
jgi:hypothetical protein